MCPRRSDPKRQDTTAAETDSPLSDLALRAASSKAIFERGLTYARSGAVSDLTPLAGTEPGVAAEVLGTNRYSTEVWLDEGAVVGSCDCPSASEGWFCKHQVAVALVWREHLAGRAPPIDPAAAKKVQATVKRAQSLRDQRQGLHDFLHRQPAADLADRLLELSDRDPGLHRSLQQWRKLERATDDPEDLKRLISEILDTGKQFVDWDETPAYLQRAEAVLPLLRRTASQAPPVRVALATHALRRAWVALERVDDSDGGVGDLCRAIGAQLVAALQSAGPQSAEFGEAWLKLRLDDPFGSFDADAAETAIGPAALARFRQRLAERWREATTAIAEARAAHAAKVDAARAARRRPPPPPETDSSLETRLRTLEHLHLQQLERTGDVDGELEVLREDLSTPLAVHRLTRALERHGRLRDAFTNAERGLKAFPDSERLQEDLLRGYERDGWFEEALALRRQRFDAAPSVTRYQEVLAAGDAARRDRATLRRELLDVLAERELRPPPPPLYRPARPDPLRAATAAPRDVSLRVEVLCSESRFDEALVLVQPPAVCRPHALEALAEGLGPAHHAASVALLQRVFAASMRGATSPYREPLRLVSRILLRLGPPARAEWLPQLREEFRAKRNFVRDLPAS